MAKNKYDGINDMPSGWTKDLNNKKVYMLWFDMLRRCYDDKQLLRSKGKAYQNCTVCDRWFCLSNFSSDILKLQGYSEWKSNGKMSIDKDLFSKGEKIYSPETCCFIPINDNVKEMNRRNPNITKTANEANKTKYVLSKDNDNLFFNSEKSACEFLGVHKCSVSSCFRRKSKCKGYTIAKMDGGNDEPTT